MVTIFFMCDEKVDRLCSILCSSPISAYTLAKTPRTDLSPAGMCSPAWPIRVSRPTVLSETVLPPVLGPVTTSRSKSSPSLISIGTTLSLGSSGCLALRILIILSLLKIGIEAFMSSASLPLANTTSSLVISFWLVLSISVCSLKRLERLARITSISLASSSLRFLISLFRFTMACGSINRVEPVEDWS